jgi:hypothetical protein
VGPAPGQQDDRLEERRLAGGIRPDDQLRTATELGVKRGIRPQVEDRDPAELSRRFRLRGRCLCRQLVVRSGITTWT